MSNGQALFANLANTTLASAAASGATSIVLSAGTGALFPNPGVGQYFIGTINPASGTSPATEIVIVTARSTDTLTVIRAQEGTTAQNWGIGAIFQQLNTAGTMGAMVQAQIYAGNPNGNVPGTSAGASMPPSMVWDSTDNLWWVCTVTGATGTAQWAAIAPLNSPTFTGAPSAPTPPAGDSTTKLATTAFVKNVIATLGFGSTFSGLKIVTTSNTQRTITANRVILTSAGGASVAVSAVNQLWASGTTGAGGLDTGTIDANTWYYDYLIYNANTSTLAAMGSLSASSPTLPSGYSYYVLCGAVPTDASGYLMRVIQRGSLAQYVVGTNPSTPPLLVSSATSSGASGGAITWTAVSVAGFVPIAVASSIVLELSSGATTYGEAAAAPNTSYPLFSQTSFATNANNPPNLYGSVSETRFLLESSSIAVFTQNSGQIAVRGWGMDW
jgi:hypothetical protein